MWRPANAAIADRSAASAAPAAPAAAAAASHLARSHATTAPASAIFATMQDDFDAARLAAVRQGASRAGADATEVGPGEPQCAVRC